MALFKPSGAASSSKLYAAATNIADFDLLIEDLDQAYPEAWSALKFENIAKTFDALTPEDVDLVIFAVTQDDEANLAALVEQIEALKAARHLVFLVVDEVSAHGIRALTRAGADDFAPYPMAEGELKTSLEQVLSKAEATRIQAAQPVKQAAADEPQREGLIMPVYGVAGGVGSTTFAVNLAYEIALSVKKVGQKVVLIDLDLQYGTVSTALEIARREIVYELLADADGIDAEAIEQVLQDATDNLSVFTTSPESLPYEFLSPESVEEILKILTARFDFVIIDAPTALTPWSDVLLRMSETYFAVMELDMRSADNMLRFLRALQAEELPVDKLQFVINRGPGFGDGAKKTRMKRLSSSLGIEFNIILPDGGRNVIDAFDHGKPLATAAPRNTLRRELKKVASTLVELVNSQKADTL